MSPFCFASSSKFRPVIILIPQNGKLALAHTGPPNFKGTNLVLERISCWELGIVKLYFLEVAANDFVFYNENTLLLHSSYASDRDETSCTVPVEGIELHGQCGSMSTDIEERSVARLRWLIYEQPCAWRNEVRWIGSANSILQIKQGSITSTIASEKGSIHLHRTLSPPSKDNL